VYYSQNLDSVRSWLIEDQYFFEARYLKYAQRGQVGVLKPRMPAYVGLGSQEAKGLVGSQEEAVT
jgi:hypothetical protein